jgi:hypothetical protein
VKGLTIMVNSISNGARMEDDWLDSRRRGRAMPFLRKGCRCPTTLTVAPI